MTECLRLVYCQKWQLQKDLNYLKDSDFGFWKSKLLKDIR